MSWIFQPIPAAAELLAGTPAWDSTGGVKVYNGVTWDWKPVKVWTGSSWVRKDMYWWTGTAWRLTNSLTEI